MHGMDTSDPGARRWSTASCRATRRGDDQGDLGRPGHARDAQRRHRPRWRLRPGQVHRAGRARRPRRRRLLRRSASSPGRSCGFGNIYYGLAQRVLRADRRAGQEQGSLALTRSMAHHPEVQHGIAEMVMELEAIGAQLEAVDPGLVGRRAAPRLADQDRRDEVQRGRDGAGRSPTARSTSPVGSGCSRRARWNACSATRAPAASTRRTRRSARTDRQARARHQSGRSAALGLDAELSEEVKI